MFVGIDIGGTTMKGILTDKAGKVLSFREEATPEKIKDIEESILQMIENLATSASVSKIDIKGIGIGSAGTIDKKKGLIIQSPNIPAFKKYPIVKNIEKKTGIKVFLENDATIALIGGWWKGNGSRFRNWIMLTLGTGIGGGIIIDNKVYTGQSGNAMEVGHMTIKTDGLACKCGNKGCLEKYASATALIDLTNQYLPQYNKSSIHGRLKDEEMTAQLIYEEALNKDELANRVFKEVGTHLGMGIVNLVNIFNPEAIIFSGGLSRAHKILLPIVKQVVKKHALPGLKENVQYLPIKDQSQIPALGAVKIAMDSINNNNGQK